MNRKEINTEVKMSYEELCQYLIRKYGEAESDYFTTSECRSKSKKISRTKDGLYCHHMDEDKGGNLGNPEQARMQPFEWQRKERLVYCNILEHLILHIKIAVIRQKEMLSKPTDVPKFFTTGGIFMLCEELNDLFMNEGTSIAWKKRCFEEVKDNYEDYVALLKSILAYIDSNYIGDKNETPFLVPGSVVHFSDEDCEILKISKKRNAFLLKLPTGEEKGFDFFVAMNQFKYLDQINIITRKMASGFEGIYEKIYSDILSCSNEERIRSNAELFKVDYVGHGYVEFSDIKLKESFGAKNADEYIAKALPMHSLSACSIVGKKAYFWNGSNMPVETKDAFYIVRVETMFTVKKGMEPFIRYRERDLLRNFKIFERDNNHNLKDRGWIILSTSDVYDRQTDKYYSKYIDRNGDIVDAVVVLTLGKEDYLLFKERYDIRYLNILDGCYFV